MQFSASFVGSVLIASVLGTAPAFAGTPASISGSATLVTPAGFISTVSGESILPSGYIFETSGATLNAAAVAPIVVGTFTTFNPNADLENSAVIVVPTYAAAGGGTFVANSLSVGSAGAVTAPISSTSFAAAAAQVLNDTAAAAPGDGILANIEFINAIIKSGSGVNGLD